MDTPSIEWGKLIAGIIGALISASCIKGASFVEKTILFFSGVAVSYYATPWVADALSMERSEGFVGFVLGLFGMSIVGKLYEFIQAIDARAVWTRVWARVESLIGGNKEG